MSSVRFLRIVGEHIVDGPAWLAVGDSSLMYPSLMMRENRPGVDPLVSMSIYEPEDDPGDLRLLRRVEWSYIEDASRRTQGPNDWPQLLVQYYALPVANDSQLKEALERLDQVLLNAWEASIGSPDILSDEPLGFYRVVSKEVGELRMELSYYEPLFPSLDARWVSVWEELNRLCKSASPSHEVEEGYDVSPQDMRRILIEGTQNLET